MMPNKFRWIIPLCAIFLVGLACGQVSIGLITPTVVNETAETSEEVMLVPTSVSITPLPTENLEPTPTTSDPEKTIPALAYVGSDGNLWVLEAGGEALRQVTFDANPIGEEGDVIVYSFPRLSSDGTLLAYNLEEGTPNASGYDFTTGLWVEKLETGERTQIMNKRSSGFAWKPGTRMLTYGTGVDMGYFITRGQPDPTLANGFRSIDLDSGEILELVAPERGYALSSPNWSPDGRFLAFSEVINMEGIGLFAYYDFESQGYVAWDESVGGVSWSPDGSLLTYTRQTYVATGDERLYLRPRLGDEQLLGPDYEGPAYVSYPIFSPDGNQIAYIARLEGPMTDTASIIVLEIASEEVKFLGQFKDVWELAWTPDGSHLVFGYGHWESRQIMGLNIEDGSQTVLASGSQPALAGQ